jgi:hypothetical protein
MRQKSQERGQALILIVFAAVGLFAFAALAIDGSRVFSDRRHAQNAADTAVLAATLSKIRTPGDDATKFAAAADAARDRAESNGFVSGVEVHQCDEAGLAPPCEGLPAGASPSEYIQVVIRLNTATTFGRILGWQQVPSTVSAIARAAIGSEPTSFQSAAISAMSETLPKALWGNGNVKLDVNNGGIFVNSNASGNCPNGGALVFNGNGTYEVDNGYQVVGGSCDVGSNDITGDFSPAAQIPKPTVDIKQPEIACDPTVRPAQWINSEYRWFVPAGTHPGETLPVGEVIFEEGNHCFPNGYRINGFQNITVNNANFLITGGEFHISTNGGFHCTNLLVHINGGTGMRINGNATNTCAGVTFYLSTGDVSWLGNSENDFTAPEGGTYQGLLIYMPTGNSKELTVTGNSYSSFTGSIIAVSSPIHLQGNGETLSLSTQIIGDTVQFSGNTKFLINYDPSKQFAGGGPTMIQVIK